MKRYKINQTLQITDGEPSIVDTAITRLLEYPADLIDLSRFKLKVPANTAQAGAPDEYRNPQLQTYADEFFHLNDAKDGIVMKANAGGYTTSGSSYPRTQLGECDANGTTFTWDSEQGKHQMLVRLAVTHLAVVKKDINVAQVHDGNGYLVAIVLKNDGKLVVEANDNGTPIRLATLEAAYQLGAEFTIRFGTSDGAIMVLYNGNYVASWNAPGTGNYFTTGAYVLTNTSKGDAPEAYGEIVLKELAVSHT
jgi:hypothetical protein